MKYLSNRQKNLKIGISSYTENNTVLEIIGKVGIGTTNAQVPLYVDGDARVTGVLTVGRASISIDGNTNTINMGEDVVIDSTGITANDNHLGMGGIVASGATIGNVHITSGIITASSGIVTYYGDGQYLTNITSGVGVATAGGTVGTGATILDFRGAGISTVTVSAGIATINIVGGSGGGEGGGASVNVGSEAPSAPNEGDLWYNSELGRIFIYYVDDSSSQWVDAAPFNIPVEPVPAKSSTSLTATEGQTTFEVSYTAGYIDVYLNGVRLNDTEFVATNGSSITLITAASVGDVLDVVEFIMGKGDTGETGASGPLSPVVSISTNSTYYPLFVSGIGTVDPYVNTTSDYFEFNPSTGTLNTNQLTVVGVVTATDFNSTSDINLKENIKTIPNAIDKVISINGVTFNWLENKECSAGVIAQEVEQILPEIVKEHEGKKSVNYNGLIGLLIEGMKEQQQQINTLKEEIENLKSEG